MDMDTVDIIYPYTSISIIAYPYFGVKSKSCTVSTLGFNQTSQAAQSGSERSAAQIIHGQMLDGKKYRRNMNNLADW